jgi:oligopeptidase B
MSESTQPLTPPIAPVRPVERVFHGDHFLDEYEWLRDKDNPEVIDYLKAENAYAEASTAHLDGLQERIFNEIATRTKQTDLTVPLRRDAFWYYNRTDEGKQYQTRCRVPATGDEPPGTDAPAADEQVILDENELATGSEFFALGTCEVSPDANLLAYSVDLRGDERFTLRVRDLRTDKDLADEIAGVFYSSAWSADASTIFYVTADEAWRPHRVWRHRVGSTADEDVVVYTEDEERFWVNVELSRNRQTVKIAISSKITTEVRLIDAARPESDPVLVAARRDGVEYLVEHAGDQLLILHNTNGANFELSSAPLTDPDPANWRCLIEASEQRRLLSIAAFAEHAVLHERYDGLTNLSVLRRTGDGFDEPERIEFDEPIYSVEPDHNPNWDARSYRLSFTSMVTPESIYDYDLDRKALLLRKQQPVLGGVRLSDYVQSREWATATDGSRVPLSVVRHHSTELDGSAPVVLYGYGSYEYSIDPYFSIPRLSLLDRGVVYVIAHVRGGGELGRHWYDEGKLLAKKNTFTDFVAAAQHLVRIGWTTPSRIVAHGGSAGGLLVGAAVNLAPTAFGGVVAQVPFVDALTTILDPSLPLTITEWEEWGNPLDDPEVYAYMKSYTPYENIAAAEYPPILALTSLNDTRVLFVEPAKWVAKLRSTVTGNAPVLLKTEMDAGHGGRSGRYDRWREAAFILAWQLDTLGISERSTEPAHSSAEPVHSSAEPAGA